MRGPSEEVRAEARRRFESTGNISAVSKGMKIRRATIRAWIEREGWIVQPSVHVDAQTSKAVQAMAQAKVIDIATKKAVEQAEASGLIGQQVDEIAESLLSHGRISKLMLSYAEKMMQDAISGKIFPGEKQSVADVFNSVVTGVSKAVASSRDIAGLKAGQISARNVQDDGRRKFEFTIAAVPEPLAETG